MLPGRVGICKPIAYFEAGRIHLDSFGPAVFHRHGHGFILSSFDGCDSTQSCCSGFDWIGFVRMRLDRR